MARRSVADLPLTARSASNTASMRLTASAAIGEMTGAPLRRFSCPATSASSKNLRRAWAQHSARVPAAGRAIGAEQRVVAGVSVGLQDAAIAREMPDRVLGAAVTRVAEQRGWGCWPCERAIIADIGPQPPDVGLGLRQDRHGGVVAVEALGGEHMRLDQQVKRPERGGAGPDLVGQGRQAEVDALARVAVALPVERLVRPELLEHDHGEQARPEQAARGGVERRGRLGHRLARPAGEPLAHGLDHLPPARDHLQRLRHVLAELRQPVRPAARTTCRRRNMTTRSRGR